MCAADLHQDPTSDGKVRTPGSLLATMLAGLLALSTVGDVGEVVAIGQVQQVSFDDPRDGDTDSRDVSITDDGNCFVYTSENIHGTPLLFSDWRTWKTCGVFDGQTLTNTLVSPPDQEAGTDYSFPQASNDASVVCMSRSRPSPAVPRKDIIMGADGTYTPLTSVDTDRGCDVSYDGSTVVYAEEDADEVLQAYLYDRQSSAKTKISNSDTLRAKWPRTSADGSRTVFVSQKATVDPTLTSSSSGLKYDEGWIYQQGTAEPERIANLAGQQCNRTHMYELMVEDWGLEAVAAEYSSPSKLGNGGTPCAPPPSCQFWPPGLAAPAAPAALAPLAPGLALRHGLTPIHRAARQLPVLRRKGRHERRWHDQPRRQRRRHLRRWSVRGVRRQLRPIDNPRDVRGQVDSLGAQPLPL